jgi:hypothetical protein
MTEIKYPRRVHPQHSAPTQKTPRLLAGKAAAPQKQPTTSTDVRKKAPLPLTNEHARKDGVTHINISSRGKTELGRALAHFSHSPFIHPYYGPFDSMEGLWHYIKADAKHTAEKQKLRELVGYRAKELGSTLTKRHVSNFKAQIIEANYFKIDQTPHLRELIIESTLPFDHYYLHGPGNVLVRSNGFGWLVEGFEEIRKMFKEGRRPDPVDYQT